MFLFIFLTSSLDAFVPSSTVLPTHERIRVSSLKISTVKSTSSMFEYLKFDGTPSFDVLARTKDYDTSQSFSDMDENIYDKNYVLCGPVIGPTTHADFAKSRTGLGLRSAFPDLQQESFGFAINPKNPYQCFYFQRWRANHSADLDALDKIYPANGIECETPVTVFSVVQTPEGKIMHDQVGAVVDRFEGNTMGKAAVYGLLHTAGMKIDGNPGKVFATIQRVRHALAGKMKGVGVGAFRGRRIFHGGGRASRGVPMVPMNIKR